MANVVKNNLILSRLSLSASFAEVSLPFPEFARLVKVILCEINFHPPGIEFLSITRKSWFLWLKE